MNTRLFPAGLPANEWVRFHAASFSDPVNGVIYRPNVNKPACGMPLGGIGTGCLDVEADGLLGFCTLFKRVWGWDGRDRVYTIPEFARQHGLLSQEQDSLPFLQSSGVVVDLEADDRGKLNLPFLGVVVNGALRILSTAPPARIAGAEQIEYWGHFPIVDMEFELDLPLAVGVRGWSPFIPGDVKTSCLPGAVFEVHLRNQSSEEQKISLVFNFCDQRLKPVQRKCHTEDKSFSGVLVESEDAGYMLGVLGSDLCRTGGSLDSDGSRWREVVEKLPQADGSTSGSCAVVDAILLPGEERVVRFFLTWNASGWHSDFPYGSPLNGYQHYYRRFYPDALSAARKMAAEHEALLARVLAWQEVIYQQDDFPGWLQDQLINILHLIVEEGYWASSADPEQTPLGDWDYQGGVFALVEGTDAAGQQCCIPCDWYGNFPLVFFFPELAWSTLRALRHFQRADGAVPFYLGQGLDMVGGSAVYDQSLFGYERQRTLNGACYADLVGRLWRCSGDEAVLEEFYPSVKQNMIYTMQQNPGAEGVVGLITDGGDEWYECFDMRGITAHAGGVRLAQLLLVAQMAQLAGDEVFAQQCHQWFEQGSRLLEGELWDDDCYLFSKQPLSGEANRLVLAFQLDGEWIGRLHGLKGIFRHARVLKTLETIERLSTPLTEGGAVTVVQRDGNPDDFFLGRMGGLNSMPASVFILAMNYLYEGKQAAGMKMAYDCLDNLVNQFGFTWDMPNVVRAAPHDSAWVYGSDYYQCMSLWALPAALRNQDLGSFAAPGGLVDAVMQAGARKVKLD